MAKTVKKTYSVQKIYTYHCGNTHCENRVRVNGDDVDALFNPDEFIPPNWFHISHVKYTRAYVQKNEKFSYVLNGITYLTLTSIPTDMTATLACCIKCAEGAASEVYWQSENSDSDLSF